VLAEFMRRAVMVMREAAARMTIVLRVRRVGGGCWRVLRKGRRPS
jgi:hypothetical protein